MKFVCDVNASSTPRYAVIFILYSDGARLQSKRNPFGRFMYPSLRGSVLEGVGVSVQWNVSETQIASDPPWAARRDA